MSLPTAQLGGMANLNVPSYVPLVQVQKPVPAWQQALLGVLASTAGAAGQQAVGNAFQRDYSPEGEGATGWDKLLHGAKTTGAMQQQDKAQAGENTRLDKRLGLERELQKANSGDAFARQVLSDQSALSRQNQEDTSRLALQREAEAGTSGRASAALQNQREMSKEEMDLRKTLQNAEQTFNNPYRAAQIEELKAQTGHVKGQTDAQAVATELQKRFMQDKNGVNEKQQKVQDALQNTQRYPTYDIPGTSSILNALQPDAKYAPDYMKMMNGLMPKATNVGSSSAISDTSGTNQQTPAATILSDREQKLQEYTLNKLFERMLNSESLSKPLSFGASL